jgi:hypothetical protein
MKLKCKVCEYVVDTTSDPVQSAIAMVKHVQVKHGKLAFAAVNAIAAYVSTFFFRPVDSMSVDLTNGTASNDELIKALHAEETYKETRKTLLQGFKEWCKAGIK